MDFEVGLKWKVEVRKQYIAMVMEINYTEIQLKHKSGLSANARFKSGKISHEEMMMNKLEVNYRHDFQA